MNEPLVCAVMLTRDRPEMAARAVRCFRAQAYQRKRLLIWDTGELNVDFDMTGYGDGEVAHIPAYREATSIGALRNEANSFWTDYPVIIHWDDDDWSHPNRIAEQVALLQSSGAEAVGYYDMLFSLSLPVPGGDPIEGAWLYQNAPGGNPSYALGTSLCYWRRTWERVSFPDVTEGEDLRWIEQVGLHAVSSFAEDQSQDHVNRKVDRPRMVASIHGGNLTRVDPTDPSSTNWTRVPQWDDYCRSAMALPARREQSAPLRAR